MSRDSRADCPIARALDVIGEKWSLLILRDLFRKGPLRFQELEASVTGIASNTLSARLKALEGKGAGAGPQGALPMGRAARMTTDVTCFALHAVPANP